NLNVARVFREWPAPFAGMSANAVAYPAIACFVPAGTGPAPPGSTGGPRPACAARVWAAMMPLHGNQTGARCVPSPKRHIDAAHSHVCDGDRLSGCRLDGKRMHKGVRSGARATTWNNPRGAEPRP